MHYSIEIPSNAQLLYDNSFALNNSVYFFFAVKCLDELVSDVTIKTDAPIFGESFIVFRNTSFGVSRYSDGIGYKVGNLNGPNATFYITATAKVV